MYFNAVREEYGKPMNSLS